MKMKCRFCAHTWEGDKNSLAPQHNLYERTVSERDAWGHERVVGGVTIQCDGYGKPGTEVR
jgi:hypothetical protein